MSSRPPTITADGVVVCYHDEPASKLVSHTSKNPNREFYVCNRPHADRCGFWFWGDDPIFTERPPPQVTTPSVDALASSNGLCTPRPSPLYSTSNFQSTPTKRKCPEGSATDPRMAKTPTSKPASEDTPSKRARLEAIEVGLRVRLQDEMPPQPPRSQLTLPEQSDTLPFTYCNEMNEATPASSPASKAATDIEQEVEPPRQRYSFLGLPPTQESESGVAPSTPKKRPPSISDGEQAPLGRRGETSLPALLTPPRSVNNIEAIASGSGSLRPEPVTPMRYKGKERARDEWDRLIENEQNPFVNTTPSFKFEPEADALKHVSRSRRSSLDSQGSSCTPTTAERITFHIAGMRDTIRTLHAHTDYLDQLDAVKYIERLERQKNALAFGEEAKKKRIAALTAERDGLKEKLRQSEERSHAKDRVIASLRARR